MAAGLWHTFAMTEPDPENKTELEDSNPDDTGSAEQERPREIGGREGPDPTRYGDWEKGGRCIDF